MTKPFRIYFVAVFVLSAFHRIFGDALNIYNEDKRRISKYDNYDMVITKDGPPPPLCKKNQPFVWCLPPDYNKNVQPWKYRSLTNSTMPWNYDFSFKVFDVQEIHEFDRTLQIDLYFGIFWEEPRLQINATAVDEDKEAHIAGFIGIPMNYFEYIWLPDLEIFGLSHFESSSILRPMSGLWVNRDKILRYNVRVRTVLSCEMNFHDYPFDSHECVFRASSFYYHQDIINCTSRFSYFPDNQRNLGYMIKMENLSSHQRSVTYNENDFATCGFRILLDRALTQIIFEVYFTSTLLVIVTWVSFILSPSTVPGRMGILVTAFLALINIFIGTKKSSPTSNGLKAVDQFLVVCIGYVFAAILEYACVLFLYGETAKPNNIGSSSSKQLGIESRSGAPFTADKNNLKFQELNKKESRNLIDRVSLILFPMTFGIFFNAYFVVHM